ncbi:hypothetical protein J6590_089801 [Homalodisca vitripennis]|nr:hypothetical protein J6590_089801 [Homalodisca vitripennis]
MGAYRVEKDGLRRPPVVCGTIAPDCKWLDAGNHPVVALYAGHLSGDAHPDDVSQRLGFRVTPPAVSHACSSASADLSSPSLSENRASMNWPGLRAAWFSNQKLSLKSKTPTPCETWACHTSLASSYSRRFRLSISLGAVGNCRLSCAANASRRPAHPASLLSSRSRESSDSISCRPALRAQISTYCTR